MVRREEIEALVSLLDDPDAEVRQAVTARLHQLHEEAIPLLDEFRAGERDPAVRDVLTTVILGLTVKSLEQEFLNYLENGVRTLEDLESGALLLARFGNPTLRADLYARKLDRMADLLREDVLASDEPLEQMFMLLSYVFKEEGFKGSEHEYFDPANSFLDQVMEHRRGLPISLAMVVLFLARRLDLPFQGVNMPLHFMLRYDASGETFFIDPFRAGGIVQPEQCRQFLKQNGIEPSDTHFEPAEPLDILARCVRNLINGYEKLDRDDLAGHMKRWYGYIELFQLNGV